METDLWEPDLAPRESKRMKYTPDPKGTAPPPDSTVICAILILHLSEDSLAFSANVRIPAEVLRPELEMVVEIDPQRTLDPTIGVANRIPEVGRLSLDVWAIPAFQLTVVPFLWSPNPDSLVLGITESMANDPHHELLAMTRTLLPVIVPPISLDSSLAIHPGSKGKEAGDVTEVRTGKTVRAAWGGRPASPSGGARGGRPRWCCGCCGGRTSAR